MKALLSSLIFFLFVCSAKGQQILDSEFQKKLAGAKAIFVKPPGAEEILIKKNAIVFFDFALKLKDKDVEARYLVWPITAEVVNAYENREKKEGDSVLNPQKLYYETAPLLYSEISGSKVELVKMQQLKGHDVNEYFGADGGLLYAGPVSQIFGQDYNYGLFITLHKDNSGDIHIIYLFKNENEWIKLRQSITSDQSIFKAIRFK